MGQNHTSANQNSIGIEMCVRNSCGNLADTSRDWYFEDATVQKAIELTKELMAKYNIPVDRVVRHHVDFTVSRIGGIGSQR
ncbi:MAG: N-acetylmuramoyl-L-alanine amidase, partial [Lacrimispora sphenoides]